MRAFTDSLAQAKALTLQGRLMEATRLIQAKLGLQQPSAPNTETNSPGAESKTDFGSPETPPAPTWRAQKAQASDIDFREWSHVPVAPQPTTTSPASTPDADPMADTVADPRSHPRATVPASFTQHAILAGTHSYSYRLFIPSEAGAATARPIVVMLHGCKQNAEDFARGTAMNAIAEHEKFIVVYPEQIRQANSMGCWNWFEPQHQQRNQGEPAMIAALVAKLVAEHGGDASRIYIAGLSAGGAMAALVGQLYPEIFAAVGVHSGLAPSVAHDVASAFSAMRRGPGARPTRPITLPLIVFQGSADKTVAPANAQAIVKTELDALAARGTVLQKDREEPYPGAGRKATRERWTDANGTCRIESWNVAAAPHAWAGGDAAGSFTDPLGPSASQAMFSFFRLHAK